jgi:hypothetical protein
MKRLPGDELWEVTLRNSGESAYVLFVLAMTGEAIGSQHGQEPSTYQLRQDWGSYITSLGRDTTKTLNKYLRCANEEDFDRGISKLWLKRMAHEGRLGSMKRSVAERYVMASVIANR